MGCTILVAGTWRAYRIMSAVDELAVNFAAAQPSLIIILILEDENA
jgi:hypothetical protein